VCAFYKFREPGSHCPRRIVIVVSTITNSAGSISRSFELITVIIIRVRAALVHHNGIIASSSLRSRGGRSVSVILSVVIAVFVHVLQHRDRMVVMQECPRYLHLICFSCVFVLCVVCCVCCVLCVLCVMITLRQRYVVVVVGVCVCVCVYVLIVPILICTLHPSFFVPRFFGVYVPPCSHLKTITQTPHMHTSSVIVTQHTHTHTYASHTHTHRRYHTHITSHHITSHT